MRYQYIEIGPRSVLAFLDSINEYQFVAKIEKGTPVGDAALEEIYHLSTTLAQLIRDDIEKQKK